MLIILTASVALLSFIQMFVAAPVMKEFRRSKAKVLVSSQEAARLRRTVESRDSVERMYEEIREKLKPAGSTESEIIGLLLSVERAAKKAGVEIIENEHVRHQTEEYLDRHLLRFKGVGTPLQIAELLHHLESPSSLLKIERVNAKMREHRLEAELELARLIGRENTDG